MMNRLRQEFMTGFREGRRLFWSPFTGLWKAMSEMWRVHLKAPRPEKRRHA